MLRHYLGVICIAVVVSSGARATDEVLSNEDVLRLVSAGVGEAAIIAKIRSTMTTFDTTVDAMIDLTDKGVAQLVLEAMVASARNVELRVAPNGATSQPGNPLGLHEWLISVSAVVVPLLVAVVAWSLNMRGKLEWEKQMQKIKRYSGLLETTAAWQGEGSVRDDAFEAFRKEWRLAWVYCPDNVISAGNEFLGAMVRMSTSIHALQSAPENDDERRKLLDKIANEQSMVVSAKQELWFRIRQDVQRGTKLTGVDYA